jgi:hypothetical protein
VWSEYYLEIIPRQADRCTRDDAEPLSADEILNVLKPSKNKASGG